VAICAFSALITWLDPGNHHALTQKMLDSLQLNHFQLWIPWAHHSGILSADYVKSKQDITLDEVLIWVVYSYS